jgi:hypothetical protein
MEIQRIDKNICNVIATGSRGNCVIYHKSIAVDMGIPFKLIKPYINDLSLIIISHKNHIDHYNLSCIKKIQFERPSIRIGCSIHDAELIKKDRIQNIDVYEIGKLYDYGSFKVCAIQLWHDVPTIGMRIFKDEHKIIHCTDTVTLEGIKAKNYSIYALECNFSEGTILDTIYEKRERGEFVYNIGSMNSHLSMEMAHDFTLKNVSPEHEYKFIPLHVSSSF